MIYYNFLPVVVELNERAGCNATSSGYCCIIRDGEEKDVFAQWMFLFTGV